MKSARSLMTLLLAGLALVSAAPTKQHVPGNPDSLMMDKTSKTNGTKSTNGTSTSGAAGAAYFITNEPNGNFVVVAELAISGQVIFNRAVATRGLGAHGITDPNGPDPLFAQGSIKASASGKILATVNPGSNTVSLFSIDPNDPVNINQIGQPASSEGEFPMSLAINKNGTQVCVLNGGTVNGVNCYSVNKDLGLVAIPNTLRSLGLNQTTPATGPAGSTSHIIFSEDNTKLIASIKGTPPTPGFLAVWDVAADGSLSQDFANVAPASGGLLPFSMTVIEGKNAILATDAGVGFDIFDFNGLNSAASQSNFTSNSSSVIPIDGQKATCWSSFSSKTGNFYLTDIGTSTVTEVNVDINLKGTIVKQYPQTANSATIDNDVAQLNGKDFMFILAANATSVQVLSLDAPGKATSVGSFNVANVAKSVGLTINPNNLQGMTTFVKA